MRKHARYAILFVLISIFALPTSLLAMPKVTTTRFTSRKVPVHVVSCSLSNGFSAVALVQPAPSGVLGASSVCADPLESARKAGLVAAINATAFMYPLDAPPEERNTRWYAGKPVRLFGLAVQDGVLRNPDHRPRQVMWFDASGRGHVGHPTAAETPVQAVADWEGPILEKGVVLSRENAVRYQRAFAGLSDGGWTLHLAVAEGGKDRGLTLAECGEFLKTLGCTDGINLDGGGSACLLTERGRGLAPVFPKGSRRPVPVLLGVRKNAKPFAAEALRPGEADSPRPSGKDAAMVVAVDGGTVAQYEKVIPLLERGGIPVLLNVEVAKIGVDPAYMTWEQVNALARRGCEFGAMVSHNPVRDHGHRAEISEIDDALSLLEKKTGRTSKAALYGWPGMTGAMREELDRRGIVHQVWRGGSLNGEGRARGEISNACVRAASGVHSAQIFPFGLASAPEVERSLADLRAAAHVLGGATNVWFAKLSECRAREAAFARYRERKERERKLIDRYAASAFRVSVAGPDWGVTRKLGEKVTFTVRFAEPDAETAPLLDGLTATVTIDNFGSRRQFEKTVPLRPESEVVCSGTLREPGFLRIRIEVPGFLPNQGRPWQRAVPFEPERIAKVGACPADFDAFWAKAVREAEKVPLDPEMELNPDRSRSVCGGKYDVYNVSFATVANRRVYGYLCIPKGGKGPFPLRVQVPGAGYGMWSWQPNPKGSADEVYLFMTVFPWKTWAAPPGAYAKLQADCRTKYGIKNEYGYIGAGLGEGAAHDFYYPVILGINRAVSWAAARPEVDASRIGYYGISQGGAFGLYLTYLNAHIGKCVSTVTAFSDLLCESVGRQASIENGWFDYDDPARAEKAMRNSPYLDTANFASRIRKPVRFVTGQCDWICPPHTVYAAYNVCPSSDKAIELTAGNHGNPGDVGAYNRWLAE